MIWKGLNIYSLVHFVNSFIVYIYYNISKSVFTGCLQVHDKKKDQLLLRELDRAESTASPEWRQNVFYLVMV